MSAYDDLLLRARSLAIVEHGPYAGGIGAIVGRQIVDAPDLKAGTVVAFPRVLLIGSRPWSQLEVDGERARRIVRTGLADVLAWLDEPPGPRPDDPYPYAGAAS